MDSHHGRCSFRLLILRRSWLPSYLFHRRMVAFSPFSQTDGCLLVPTGRIARAYAPRDLSRGATLLQCAAK